MGKLLLLSSEPLNPVSCREVNGIEYFDAPRETLGTRSANPLLSKTIKTEVPQFKSLLAAALSKRIQFGMHLVKQISILAGKRMCLHLIRTNGNHPALVKDHAAMPLRAVNTQTNLLGKFVQVAWAVDQSFVAS